MTPSPASPPSAGAPPPGSAPLLPTARAGAIPPAPVEKVPARTEAAPRKVRFSAPNARNGEAYRASVEGQDEQGQAVLITAAQLPQRLGLDFDPATGVLRGTPREAGEHPVILSWQDEVGRTHEGAFTLIVNANPRDLWKEVEPDPQSLYVKPHTDARCVDASGRRLLAASRRGRSHAHTGSFRDDDFFIAHDTASTWSVLIVTDGAGSAQHARHGAALAAHRTGNALVDALAGDGGRALETLIAQWRVDPPQGDKPLKDRLYRLFGEAAWAALDAIETEALQRGAEVRDYATTLLCAVQRSTPIGVFVASFWVGDGAICACGPAGRVHLMGQPDSGEFAGQTRFLDRAVLGDAEAVWKRIAFTEQPEVRALLLVTDGISDPFFETDQALADPTAWAQLWEELVPALAAEHPEQAVLGWMNFFKPGHHDDRTLAMWW
ncbi:MAG: protein phosphatase 2C domain-containing protein [Pseudomonadota bacterium]